MPTLCPTSHLFLPPRPFVEGLVHDQEAHAVAEVEKFRRGRIVAAADGVAARLLEEFQTPLPDLDRHGRAQRAASWCRQTPLSFSAWPLIEKPLAGSNLKVRMPKGVW